MTLDQQLDDAVHDGKITPHDADEVRQFAAYLVDAGPPTPGQPFTPRALEALRKHYPEDFAAIAEAKARR